MPTREELDLFALGGHNAEALAVMCFAARTGISAASAREILRTGLALAVMLGAA